MDDYACIALVRGWSSRSVVQFKRQNMRTIYVHCTLTIHQTVIHHHLPGVGVPYTFTLTKKIIAALLGEFFHGHC